MDKIIVSTMERDVIGAMLYAHKLISFNALVVINDLIKSEDWETIRRILSSINITISFNTGGNCSIRFNKHNTPEPLLSPPKQSTQCHSIW